MLPRIILSSAQIYYGEWGKRDRIYLTGIVLYNISREETLSIGVPGS